MNLIRFERQDATTELNPEAIAAVRWIDPEYHPLGFRVTFRSGTSRSYSNFDDVEAFTRWCRTTLATGGTIPWETPAAPAPTPTTSSP